MGNSVSAAGYAGKSFYQGHSLSKSGATSSAAQDQQWHQESKVRYGSYRAPLSDQTNLSEVPQYQCGSYQNPFAGNPLVDGMYTAYARK